EPLSYEPAGSSDVMTSVVPTEMLSVPPPPAPPVAVGSSPSLVSAHAVSTRPSAAIAPTARSERRDVPAAVIAHILTSGAGARARAHGEQVRDEPWSAGSTTGRRSHDGLIHV